MEEEDITTINIKQKEEEYILWEEKIEEEEFLINELEKKIINFKFDNEKDSKTYLEFKELFLTLNNKFNLNNKINL